MIHGAPDATAPPIPQEELPEWAKRAAKLHPDEALVLAVASQFRADRDAILEYLFQIERPPFKIELTDEEKLDRFMDTPTRAATLQRLEKEGDPGALAEYLSTINKLIAKVTSGELPNLRDPRYAAESFPPTELI